MCMLSYYPGGVLPDAERLMNGCAQNKDGYGFAIVTPRGELIVRKGLKADDMVDAFVIARTLNPSGPALFHSRWATSGEISPDMCHPFAVGRDSRTVVAHNGVLFSPAKESRESDTAIFARAVLPQYNIDRPAKRLRLERYLAGNKIVVLTTNPRYRHSAYLFGEDLGHWVAEDGTKGDAHESEWHSNRDYESWGRYGGAWNLDEDGEWIGYAHGSTWASRGSEGATGWPTEMGPTERYVKELGDFTEDDCVYCWSGPVDQDGYCVACSTCQDCGDVLDDCDCYTPTTARVAAYSADDDGGEDPDYTHIRTMSDTDFQAYLRRKYGTPQLALPAGSVPSD